MRGGCLVGRKGGARLWEDQMTTKRAAIAAASFHLPRFKFKRINERWVSAFSR